MRGHQGFEIRQVGKQRIFMNQGVPALLLKTLQGGQRMGEIVGKLLADVLVYPVADDKQATAGDRRSNRDQRRDQQYAGSDTTE